MRDVPEGPDSQTPIERQGAARPIHESHPRRILRWTGRLLSGLLVILLAAALVGAVYQTLATQDDAKKYPRRAKWWT